MTTPIRPSLAQMLNPQSTPAAKPTADGSFVSALSAQKAFFQQVTAPKITPATYTAADITRATTPASASQVSTGAQDATQPLRRPGSYLNIVI
ncbi:hypothetical protein MMA231_00343 [Asticcacaulis sp. MM231]|uniref:hypothetical protein n=1 Tax=Asticcacaulis sp. MM231 TaxID=3157666 RepID=UPI0032D58630